MGVCSINLSILLNTRCSLRTLKKSLMDSEAPQVRMTHQAASLCHWGQLVLLSRARRDAANDRPTRAGPCSFESSGIRFRLPSCREYSLQCPVISICREKERVHSPLFRGGVPMGNAMDTFEEEAALHHSSFGRRRQYGNSHLPSSDRRHPDSRRWYRIAIEVREILRAPDLKPGEVLLLRSPRYNRAVIIPRSDIIYLSVDEEELFGDVSVELQLCRAQIRECGKMEPGMNESGRRCGGASRPSSSSSSSSSDARRESSYSSSTTFSETNHPAFELTELLAGFSLSLGAVRDQFRGLMFRHWLALHRISRAEASMALPSAGTRDLLREDERAAAATSFVDAVENTPRASSQHQSLIFVQLSVQLPGQPFPLTMMQRLASHEGMSDASEGRGDSGRPSAFQMLKRIAIIERIDKKKSRNITQPSSTSSMPFSPQDYPEWILRREGWFHAWHAMVSAERASVVLKELDHVLEAKEQDMMTLLKRFETNETSLYQVMQHLRTAQQKAAKQGTRSQVEISTKTIEWCIEVILSIIAADDDDDCGDSESNTAQCQRTTTPSPAQPTFLHTQSVMSSTWGMSTAPTPPTTTIVDSCTARPALLPLFRFTGIPGGEHLHRSLVGALQAPPPPLPPHPYAQMPSSPLSRKASHLSARKRST